jgi:hypothetical protein
MSQFLASRRKQINAKGRPMTLRRLLTTSTKVDVTLNGFISTFRPEQIGVGAIQQGDASIAILNDEIVAAAWPGPPRTRDQMLIDGRVWTVQGSTPIYEGTDCIGYNLFCRGG